jgi:hypothetical protein
MTTRLESVEFTHPSLEAYLSRAIKRTPNPDKTLDEILGSGDAYLIFHNDILVGATYIEIVDIGYGAMINVILLAGDFISVWRDGFANEMRRMGRERNIKHLCIVGRFGWDKIFPELKYYGSIFIASDTP